MAMDWERDILGELVDKGYSLKEWEDYIELRYKDQSVAAFSRVGVDKAAIRRAGRRHELQLQRAVGAIQ
jgi:hypothetical protein